MSFIFNPVYARTLQKTIIFSQRCLSKTSHYTVLNITPTATKDEIRAAFIKLSKQYHPDSNQNNPNSHEDFIRIKHAYDVLNDAKQRRKYDMAYHKRIYRYSRQSEKEPDMHQEFWTNIEPEQDIVDKVITAFIAFCVFYFYYSIIKVLFGLKRRKFFEKHGKNIEEVQQKDSKHWSTLDKEVVQDYIKYQKEITQVPEVKVDNG